MSSVEARCRRLIVQGADWLAKIARVRSEADRFEDPRRYPHPNYAGAIRNEYDTRTGTWYLNGPVWHTGQAIRSLLVAHRHSPDPSLLDACLAMGRFVVANIVEAPGHPNDGLLLAYEGDNVTVNNQTVFETLPGLLDLAQWTQDVGWTAHARRAADFALRGLLPEEGLIVDHYHVERAQFVRDPDNPLPGRPLLDGGTLVQLARATGDETYLRAFLTMSDRALREENPPGTWIIFPPWHADSGRLHIRTSWWWGYPLLQAYDLSGDARFWQATLRVGDWYLAQQNLDGGFYYSPLRNGKHVSLGLATSGAAVACIIWSDLYGRTGDPKYRDAVNRSVRFLLAAQFAAAASDPNIRGALWESPNPPDGTACPGFLIRDIATILAIQAADRVLSTAALLEEVAPAWDHSMPW